jgi:hypothetical protein
MRESGSYEPLVLSLLDGQLENGKKDSGLLLTHGKSGDHGAADAEGATFDNTALRVSEGD